MWVWLWAWVGVAWAGVAWRGRGRAHPIPPHPHPHPHPSRPHHTCPSQLPVFLVCRVAVLIPRRAFPGHIGCSAPRSSGLPSVLREKLTAKHSMKAPETPPDSSPVTPHFAPASPVPLHPRSPHANRRQDPSVLGLAAGCCLHPECPPSPGVSPGGAREARRPARHALDGHPVPRRPRLEDPG